MNYKYRCTEGLNVADLFPKTYGRVMIIDFRLFDNFYMIMKHCGSGSRRDVQIAINKRLKKSRKPSINKAKEFHSNGFDPGVEWKRMWLESNVESPIFDSDQHKTNAKEFSLSRRI